MIRDARRPEGVVFTNCVFSGAKWQGGGREAGAAGTHPADRRPNGSAWGLVTRFEVIGLTPERLVTVT